MLWVAVKEAPVLVVVVQKGHKKVAGITAC
jgi:hypothetical protein